MKMNMNNLKGIKLSYVELMYSLGEFLRQEHKDPSQYNVREDIINIVVALFNTEGVIKALKRLNNLDNLAFNKVEFNSLSSFITNFKYEERWEAIQLPFVTERLESFELNSDQIRQFIVSYFKEVDHLRLINYFDSIGSLNFKNEDEASLKNFIILFADTEEAFAELVQVSSLRQALLEKCYPQDFIPACLKDSAKAEQLLLNLVSIQSNNNKPCPKSKIASSITKHGMFQSTGTVYNPSSNNQSEEVTYTKGPQVQ